MYYNIIFRSLVSGKCLNFLKSNLTAKKAFNPHFVPLASGLGGKIYF